MQFRVKDFIALTSREAKEKVIEIRDRERIIKEEDINDIINNNILKISCEDEHLILHIDSGLPVDKTIYRNHITDFESIWVFYYYIIDNKSVNFNINFQDPKCDYLFGFDWAYDEMSQKLNLTVNAYNSFIHPFEMIYLPR